MPDPSLLAHRSSFAGATEAGLASAYPVYRSQIKTKEGMTKVMRVFGWFGQLGLYTVLWAIGFAVCVGVPVFVLERLVNGR
jgi:hypothetical protein